MVWYILKNARKHDVLLMYHLSKNTMVLGRLYKYLDPKGKLFVKADGAFWVERMRHYEKPFNLDYPYKNGIQRKLVIVKRYIWRWRFQALLKNLDRFMIEDRTCYQELLQRPLVDVDLSTRVRHMFNGVDTELMTREGIVLTDIVTREKNFLTVGWVGTGAKNTDMLLRAAEKVKFNGWKLYIVGDLEFPEYQHTVDYFFERNPHLKKTVIFTGGIYDKKKLWDLYNRCRVYIMNSRYESFNLSMLDGYWFHQYILATNVGFTPDMFAMGAAGELLEQDNSDLLAEKMQAICNGATDVVAKVKDTKYEDVSWYNMINQIV